MIYALVVVYNKSCADSNSIKDIQKIAPDISVIIYDNSTKNYGNEEFCMKQKFTYFSQNTNIGISKAYNYVVDHMIFNDGDYIIMLDDDTHLTQEYLNEAINTANTKKYDVILPIVQANGKIISPYNYYMNCRSKMVEDPKELVLSKVSGINSGMVINTSLFKKVRYNEELFLDYVDYDFMRRVHSVNARITIMKSRIDQEFQFFNYDKKNMSGALFRFKIDMHDYKILCRETGESWFFYVHAFKFMLRQTKNYHTVKFIRLYMKECLRGK